MMLAVTASRSASSMRSISSAALTAASAGSSPSSVRARSLRYGKRGMIVGVQLELVEDARHVQGDAFQPRRRLRGGVLALALLADVGLRADHAPRPAVGVPFDDAAAFLVPAPAAVAGADAVGVFVVLGLAARVAQVGLVVAGQRRPGGSGGSSPPACGPMSLRVVAQLLQAVVDVAEPVAVDVPFPDEGAAALQRAADHLDVAGARRRLRRRRRRSAAAPRHGYAHRLQPRAQLARHRARAAAAPAAAACRQPAQARQRERHAPRPCGALRARGVEARRGLRSASAVVPSACSARSSWQAQPRRRANALSSICSAWRASPRFTWSSSASCASACQSAAASPRASRVMARAPALNARRAASRRP